MTIAMDGPAGAGKSTVAKKVAEKLGIHYVDTGAMYRAIAYGIVQQQILPACTAGACTAGADTAIAETKIAAAVQNMQVDVRYVENAQHVYVNGEDVTGCIRTQEVSDAASKLAVYQPVREKLVELQRQIARDWEVVMDGRDIGTVVLPDAELKIYITAEASERARRRAAELEQKGAAPIDLAWMEKEIRERDERDMNRAISPLRQAEDAVLVDTTHMSIEEVVDTICQLAAERKAAGEV